MRSAHTSSNSVAISGSGHKIAIDLKETKIKPEGEGENNANGKYSRYHKHAWQKTLAFARLADSIISDPCIGDRRMQYKVEEEVHRTEWLYCPQPRCLQRDHLRYPLESAADEHKISRICCVAFILSCDLCRT